MRKPLRWMLPVSARRFVASLGFVIVGVRSSRSVYAAVSTVITAEGTTETVPWNDAEWARVGSNAAQSCDRCHRE